jgi:hypothetical protein
MGELCSSIRRIDRLMPMGAREFNGLVDDLLLDVAKVNEARGRLMQRSGAGQAQVPPDSQGLLPDGTRAEGGQPFGQMR